jgi:uncharacterized protein (DUF2147 family)
MYFKIKKIIFLIIWGFYSSIKIQAQDMFLGYWANENRGQIIKIYKEDADYYGEIIFRKDITLKEIKNKIVLSQMKKRNRKMLYGRTYFDYNLNKEYEVKLELEDDKTIHFTGFYSVSNIYSVWHRIP